MKQIVTYTEAKRYKLAPATILDAVNSIVCIWLRGLAMWDFSKRERDAILSAAIGAHFLSEGRMRTVIRLETINSVAQQYFNVEARHSYEDILKYLVQAAPKFHLSARSKRRTWFLEAKRDLESLRDVEVAKQLAEIMYALLAVLEDREIRGSQAAVQ